MFAVAVCISPFRGGSFVQTAMVGQQPCIVALDSVGIVLLQNVRLDILQQTRDALPQAPLVQRHIVMEVPAEVPQEPVGL
jgi:hypothetical protein